MRVEGLWAGAFVVLAMFGCEEGDDASAAMEDPSTSGGTAADDPADAGDTDDTETGEAYEDPPVPEEVVWELELFDDETASRVMEMAIGPEGSIYLAISERDYGSDLTAVKLHAFDADGAELWQRTIGESDAEADDAALAVDGDRVALALAMSYFGFDTPRDYQAAWVFDGAGNQVWTTAQPTNSLAYKVGVDLRGDSLVLAGSQEAQFEYWSTNSYWVAAFRTSSPNPVWSWMGNHKEGELGGTGYDVAFTDDGGVLATGLLGASLHLASFRDDGEVVWEGATDLEGSGDLDLTRGPDDTFFIHDENTVVALRTDGALMGSFQTAADLGVSPLDWRDGQLAVGATVEAGPALAIYGADGSVLREYVDPRIDGGDGTVFSWRRPEARWLPDGDLIYCHSRRVGNEDDSRVVFLLSRIHFDD